MSDPRPDRRVAVTNADDPRDPIAVAFAALTAPEHQDQTGSRPRATWNTPPAGGRVDPLAVMRDALAADDEEQDIADEATRPGLFSRLTDRSRGGSNRRRGRGDDAAAGEEPLVAPEVEAAADPEGHPDTSTADEGWVHHDGSDATGHEGWLYHYADGTIVDADGTVYEYAAAPADEASPQVEPAEPAPEPAPASEEDRHDDADPVAEAEVADEAEPGPEAKAEDEPAPDPEPEPVAVDAAPVTMPTQEVRPEPEPDPEPQPEPEHDAIEDHTDPEPAPEPTSAEEEPAEEEPAEVDPQPVTMLTHDEEPSAHAEAEPERESEPEPEPEPTEVDPEPVAMLTPDAEQDTENQTDTQPEPDAAHETETETDHSSERRQQAVPAFVEYSSGDAPRYVAGAVLLVASVVAVLVLVSAIADRSGSAFFVAVLLGVLAAGASWFLTRWEPTVVTLRDGRLEVTRGDDGDYFDLSDPATEVHLDGNPGSPTWRARFSEPEGSKATLRPTQVKARQFVDIVEHHRSHAPDKSPAEAD